MDVQLRQSFNYKEINNLNVYLLDQQLTLSVHRIIFAVNIKLSIPFHFGSHFLYIKLHLKIVYVYIQYIWIRGTQLIKDMMKNGKIVDKKEIHVCELIFMFSTFRGEERHSMDT